MSKVSYYWCWEWSDRIKEFEDKGWKNTGQKSINNFYLQCKEWKGRAVPKYVVLLKRIDYE